MLYLTAILGGMWKAKRPEETVNVQGDYHNLPYFIGAEKERGPTNYYIIKFKL